jgi:cell wall-associated NlpC family hydrolase
VSAARTRVTTGAPLRLIALVSLAVSFLLAGCGGPPHGREAQAQSRIPGQPGSGQAIAESALSYLGTPYRYGGSNRRGVDCSGLVHRIFLDQGFVLPRTAAEQARHGMPVSPRDLAAGDVVFFRTSGNKTSHVGIYVGDGHFVHAPGTGDRVKVSRLDSSYFQPRYVGGRRMVQK